MHRNQQPTTPGCHRDKLGTNTMAKYNVTYKCGHEEEMQLVGKHADRDRKIAYYKTIDCPKCRAEQAKKEDADDNLPLLKGSDKQISWASEIRRNFITALADFRSQATITSVIDAMGRVILAQDRAKYWIDNGGSLCDVDSLSHYLNYNLRPLFVDPDMYIDLEADFTSDSELIVPPLQGSEKQVAWASAIRDSVIRSIERARVLIDRPNALAKSAKILFAEDNARFWIDHEHNLRWGIMGVLDYLRLKYWDMYKSVRPKRSPFPADNNPENDNNPNTNPKKA